MKKLGSVVLALCLAALLLAGCAGGAGSSSQPASSGAVASGTVRIAGLKGPTTMGMVKMMKDADNGESAQGYDVQMYGTPDEIVPKITKGEIDAAAIPANLASVLFNQTGNVQVAAINTLGVLYVVETGDTVHSVADLAGKTLYSTGKGTTPEFALNYILQQNGLDPETDLTIEYKSEATEIAALLAEGEDAVAVLPQPYATAVQTQNDKVRTALDLTQEWEKVSEDSGLVTGVLVVNKDYLAQNEDAVKQLLADYKNSIEWVNANTADAAELVAEYGIVEKAPIAQKALPLCNIVYIGGGDMKQMLSGYLQVLHDQNTEAVGGEMPADEFYYGA